ncbi:hypothetical protein GCM10009765_18480 [Fodinicola feengrottensis]|uniref:Uncharacterized protein n=1 Tax=Fodinicola feengrottensis TaxID=435914 RepID=A0ABN2GD69_9ACTN
MPSPAEPAAVGTATGRGWAGCVNGGVAGQAGAVRTVADPDAGCPYAGRPDTGCPDTGCPDTGWAEVGIPETGGPDTG